MALHEGAKKILAGSDNCCFNAAGCNHHSRRRQYGCSFHLHIILVMKKTNHPTVTILALTTSLVVLHFITKMKWPLLASAILGGVSVVFPMIAVKVDYVWRFVTKGIGIVMQYLTLAFIFFFFLTPIALLSRMFSRRDPLQLSNNMPSTFLDVKKPFDKKGFEKPW